MAAPIAHIVLALQVLTNNLLPHVNPKEFILGTTFPDIRYLGVIDRDATHDETVTWHDVQTEKSSFIAGMKFHSLVDRLREEYMVGHHIYDFVPQSPYITQSLKVLEDSLLFKKISDWDTIYAYFNSIDLHEKEFGISRKDIRRWHTFNQRYILLQKWYTTYKRYFFWKPLSQALIFVITKLQLSKKAINDIITLTYELDTNKKVKKIIRPFYDNFLMLLT